MTTEEKQGVSAWLRGIVDESYGKESRPLCTGIVETFFGVKCREKHTCGSCILEMLTVIADRIDAERALPEGVEWPRFEDGRLVRIGDELEFEGKTMLVCDATFYADGWALWCDREDMSGRLYGKYGERVKRPVPKVLDADGAPINAGDVVYFVGGSGVRYAVKDIGFEPDGAFVDIIDEDRYSATVNPESLTHERPDSWERLEADAKKKACDIAGSSYCGNCRFRHGIPFLSCDMKARIELVERAKALAKAGE